MLKRQKHNLAAGLRFARQTSHMSEGPAWLQAEEVKER